MIIMIDKNKIWNFCYNSQVRMHSYYWKIKEIVSNMDLETQGLFRAMTHTALDMLDIWKDTVKEIANISDSDISYVYLREIGILTTVLDKESELLCQLSLDIGNETVCQYDDEYLLDPEYSFQDPTPIYSEYIEDYL